MALVAFVSANSKSGFLGFQFQQLLVDLHALYRKSVPKSSLLQIRYFNSFV
jgi:hypothetical protein